MRIGRTSSSVKLYCGSDLGVAVLGLAGAGLASVVLADVPAGFCLFGAIGAGSLFQVFCWARRYSFLHASVASAWKVAICSFMRRQISVLIPFRQRLTFTS